MKEFIEAIIVKSRQVREKYNVLDKRSKPRVPNKLKWVLEEWGGSSRTRPKNCTGMTTLSVNSTYPLDSLARTFAALEDFEDWIKKAEEGAKKFQQAMESQAEKKIMRLQTFAALGDFKNKIDDVPF